MPSLTRHKKLERRFESLEQRQMFATHLLADLNTNPVEIAPQELHTIGEQTLFFAQKGLWKTDGTNTAIVKELDIKRSNQASVLGDKLIFVAYDPEHGNELWGSDGTSSGTRLLMDTVPGEADGIQAQFDNTFVNAGGELYFRVGDGTQALWKTDGTAAGTQIVTEDIGSIGEMAAFNDEVYFTAGPAFQSQNLWKWNGRLVSVMEAANQIEAVTDGHVFFIAQKEDDTYALFSTDASDSDPVELTATTSLSSLRGHAVGDTFYFVPTNSQEVWVSDGTVEGTQKETEVQHVAAVVGSVGDRLLLGIDRPPGWFPIKPVSAAAANSRMVSSFRVAAFFDELWSIEPNSGDREQLTTWASYSATPPIWYFGEEAYFAREEGLWKTNGTAEGTELVQTDDDVNSRFFDATILNDRLLFAARFGLWTTAGSPDSTLKLAVDSQLTHDAMPREGLPGVAEFQTVGDATLFIANDALYRTDGTESGTSLLKSWTQLNVEPPLFQVYPSTNFVSLPFLGKAIISVTTPDARYELWSSDGTQDGTTKIAENLDQLQPITQTDEVAYFRTISGQIWRLDASLELEQILSFESIRTQTGSPNMQFGIVDNRLVMQSTNVTCGESPNCEWALELRTIVLGSDTAELIGRFESNQNFMRQIELPLVPYGDSLAFVAATDELGYAVWTTDGTSEGTELFWEPQSSSTPSSLIPIGDVLLVETEGNGGEFWRIDGAPGSEESIASDFEVRRGRDFRTVGDHVLMVVEDEAIGTELWTTNGVTGHRIDIRAGIESSYPTFLTEHDGKVYFTANDGIHGYELWVTDGTPNNTRMVTDIAPGPDSSSPDIRPTSIFDIFFSPSETLEQPLRRRDDEFYFAATTEEFGRELWKSDGTAEGTTLLADVAAGPDSSTPHSITVVGGDLFFAADGDLGFEPWVYNPESALLPGDVNGDGSVTFEDFLILSTNFGKQDQTRADGDLDQNGEVAFVDFLILSANFGRRRIFAGI